MADFYTHAWFWWPVFIAAALALAAGGAKRGSWALALFVLMCFFSTGVGAESGGGTALLWTLYLILLVLMYVAPLRRWLFSNRLYRFYKASMPAISGTERDALEAGTVWWDAELFTGQPRWQTLLDFPGPTMPPEEVLFIAGPTEELCGMLDDHRICNVDKDLTPETWRFMKSQGFFGMTIPKEYGGKGMSAVGHASVVMKIASRSISAALTVMIPNSVGPGKLLLKYGTDAQKAYWLPRLARGEEIPCFALTGPEAGSDAGAIPDTGVVCHGDYDGKRDILGIRLNFHKRYISMAPVATVLGLAFKLEDPEHLLGPRTHLGITLALVPASTSGVSQGRRHNPLHLAFMNGPLQGRDVFIPLEFIIGGPPMAGKGWRMLMESLTDGRAISLPALSTATAKLAARVTGAYSRVRRQFKLPISQFEGVQEALARLAGNTYCMDAARLVTLAALDQGHKPAVVSAIVKYNLTARARQVMNDAMDVHGGAALFIGPRNPLGPFHSYPQMGVTVEGHNILTRNLITFGQGAIRCHPWLLKELQAVSDEDTKAGRKAFDQALLSHLRFTAGNKARTLLHGLTGARFADVPGCPEAIKHYYRQLTRMSAAFAYVSDVLLLTLRGELKRRERLSARMADVLSQLYLASAALKHYHDQGNQPEDLPLVQWVCDDALYQMQQSFDALFKNMPGKYVPAVVRWLVFPLGRSYRAPADSLERALSDLLHKPTGARDRLTAGMYLSPDPEDKVHVLDEAMCAAVETRGLRERLRSAQRAKTLLSRGEAQLPEAVEKGVLTAAEAEAVRRAESLRREAIQVDDFTSLKA